MQPASPQLCSGDEDVKTFRLLAATAIAVTAVPLAAASMDGFSPRRLSAHVQELGSDAGRSLAFDAGQRNRRPSTAEWANADQHRGRSAPIRRLRSLGARAQLG